MSAKEQNAKVLMELRPAFEGFAGIPQETRLIYSMFRDLDRVDVTGLINTYSKSLAKGIKRDGRQKDLAVHERVQMLSKHIVSHKERSDMHAIEKFKQTIAQHKWGLKVKAMSLFGLSEQIYDFDAKDFEDFIWRNLFSKSLPANEYTRITSGDFAILRSPWKIMHRNGMYGMLKKYLKINTQGYDYFLTQTPFPAVMTGGTRMIVRYHDAIPMFLPHTIPNTKFHQLSHYRALISNNNNDAIFACTSEATRQELLKIIPEAEKRSPVIHDVVSHNYYEDSASIERIGEIIRSSIEPTTQPELGGAREKVTFYKRTANPKYLKYLLMVSTIEPRKNHMKLIGAWEILRQKLDPDLKLIIVGRPGWGCENVINAMRTWQERGELFNLSGVPASDLRVLYNGAEAVVCPSVSEGFDLSGVEAMLCGGAVVASDIPVHREVYGNACEYFDPYSTMDAANAIEKVIHPENNDHRKWLIENGLKQSWRYKRESIAPKWQRLFDALKSGARVD